MWRFRGAGRMAMACGVFLAAAVLAGASDDAVGARSATSTAATLTSAKSTQSVRISVAYACQFPFGNEQTNVVIAAAFPTAAAAGRPIQPTGIQITAVLPESAVGELRKANAASVGASDSLAVTEAYPAKTAAADWRASTPATAVLPPSGGLQLVTAGTAPPAAGPSQGTITFTAGRLVLALAPRTAAGMATDPVTVRVACAPTAGANVRLASVSVSPVAASTSPAGAQGNQRLARHKLKLPKGCGHIKVVGTGVATCGYITGYSDVQKLYGAALLQPRRPARPGLVNVDLGWRHVFKPGELIEYSTGELYYRGRHELPPVRATFLAFRFVPVTATLGITELTPIKIVSISGITAPPYPITIHATSRVAISLSNVDVNGVPLAVGPHCRPVSSVRLSLTGHGYNTIPPKGYTLPTGGPLSGTLTVPAFTGCGVTENLDAVLTASISGPRNFLKMTQGQLCGPSQPQNWTCPPPVPKPIH